MKENHAKEKIFNVLNTVKPYTCEILTYSRYSSGYNSMKKILLLNGPNLNLLGTREPDKYGNKTLADIESSLSAYVSEKDAKLSCYQSNHEGDLVDP